MSTRPRTSSRSSGPMIATVRSTCSTWCGYGARPPILTAARRPARKLMPPTAGTADRCLRASVVWQGRFELMLIGPAEERWDLCFIAEYPSVAAFVEMIRDPVYREAVKHRQAAVEDSRLIRHAVLPVGANFGEIPAWESEGGLRRAFAPCPPYEIAS